MWITKRKKRNRDQITLLSRTPTFNIDNSELYILKPLISVLSPMLIPGSQKKQPIHLISLLLLSLHCFLPAVLSFSKGKAIIDQLYQSRYVKKLS